MVESSIFGSNFVAMRIAIELMTTALLLQNKLQGPSVGTPIILSLYRSPSIISKNPKLTLKKKHAAINYHCIREAIAAMAIQVAKEDTSTNLAALLT